MASGDIHVLLVLLVLDIVLSAIYATIVVWGSNERAWQRSPSKTSSLGRGSSPR